MTEQQNAMATRARALRERVAQDYPQAWDFKEITEIVGVVESIDRVETERGPKAVAAIREVDGAEQRWSVWLSQTALKNRFEELDIRPGELVAIKYLGIGEASRPGMNPPHRFRVEVDRSQGGSGFDWGAISEDDEVGGRRLVRQPTPEQEYEAEQAQAKGDDDIPF